MGQARTTASIHSRNWQKANAWPWCTNPKSVEVAHLLARTASFFRAMQSSTNQPSSKKRCENLKRSLRSIWLTSLLEFLLPNQHCQIYTRGTKLLNVHFLRGSGQGQWSQDLQGIIHILSNTKRTLHHSLIISRQLIQELSNKISYLDK